MMILWLSLPGMVGAVSLETKIKVQANTGGNSAAPGENISVGEATVRAAVVNVLDNGRVESRIEVATSSAGQATVEVEIATSTRLNDMADDQPSPVLPPLMAEADDLSSESEFLTVSRWFNRLFNYVFSWFNF